MSGERWARTVGVGIGLSIGLVLWGCAPRSAPPPTSWDVRNGLVKSYLDAGKWLEAFREIRHNLLSTYQSARDQDMALIRPYPQFIPGLVAELKRDIQLAQFPSDLENLRRLTEQLRQTGLADPSQVDDLLADLAHADRALKGRGVVVQLKTEPPRRLLEEDLATILRRTAEFITIVRTPQPEAVMLLIRELQFEERQEPERTQTMVVSNWQTDVLVSALTMPRGASMLYEYTQGSAEIAWAFEVIVSKADQVVQEQLLRDTIRRPYHFCANMRVQNVFGGVQSAMTYPNNEVKTLCESGQRPTRTSDLRSQVIERLAREITTMLRAPAFTSQPAGNQ
jgi:hypothetical protein